MTLRTLRKKQEMCTHSHRHTQPKTHVFGVGEDVVRGLRVVLTLHQPLPIALTVSRQMIGLSTLEAADRGPAVSTADSQRTLTGSLELHTLTGSLGEHRLVQKGNTDWLTRGTHRLVH